MKPKWNIKSKKAFEFTLDDMEGQLYFWTFTFVKPTNFEDCAKAWNRLWSNVPLLMKCPI